MQYPPTPRSKWKTLQGCLKLKSQNVQTFGYVYHNTKWPESWSSMEDPVVPLGRKLYGHPAVGLSWERPFEEVSMDLDGKKCRIGNACLFIGNKDYFYRCMWMILTWLERSSMWLPCGNRDEKVGLDEPTSFLAHEYSGCTQRECRHHRNNYQ